MESNPVKKLRHSDTSAVAPASPAASPLMRPPASKRPIARSDYEAIAQEKVRYGERGGVGPQGDNPVPWNSPLLSPEIIAAASLPAPPSWDLHTTNLLGREGSTTGYPMSRTVNMSLSSAHTMMSPSRSGISASTSTSPSPPSKGSRSRVSPLAGTSSTNQEDASPSSSPSGSSVHKRKLDCTESHQQGRVSFADKAMKRRRPSNKLAQVPTINPTPAALEEEKRRDTPELELLKGIFGTDIEEKEDPVPPPQFPIAHDKPVWRKLKITCSPPTPRYGHTSTCIGNKVFVFGGGGDTLHSDALYLLLLSSFRWHTMSCSGAEPCNRAHHTANVIGDSLVLYGGSGFGVDDAFYILNTNTTEWKKVDAAGDSPGVRAFHTMTGQVAETGTITNDVYIFEWKKLKWKQIHTTSRDTQNDKGDRGVMVGEMPPPLYGHSSFYAGKYIYVFGGRTQASALISRDVAVFHGGVLSGHQAAIPQTASGAGSLISKTPSLTSVAGAVERQYHSNTYLFHFDTRRWEKCSPNHSLSLRATLTSSSSIPVPAKEKEKSGSGQYAKEEGTPVTPEARAFHSSTIITGNRFLVFGGRRGQEESAEENTTLSTGSSVKSWNRSGAANVLNSSIVLNTSGIMDSGHRDLHSSNSGSSNGNSALWNDVWLLQVTLPPAPENVRFGKVSATRFEINWNPVECRAVDHFVVEYSDDGGATWKEGYIGNSHTCYLTNLEINKTYNVRVFAVNDLGRSLSSELITRSTLLGSPPGPVNPPEFGRVFQRQISVKWQPPQETGGHPITGYILEISTEGNKVWEQIYEGEKPSYKASNLNADTQYYFRVKAVNAFGSGRPVVSAPVVTQPPRVQVSSKTLSSNDKDHFQQRIAELLKENELLREKNEALQAELHKRKRDAADVPSQMEF